MVFCCPATPHVCDPYCSCVYVFCVIFDEHYAVQELANVKRRVKALQTGPRHFEHILLNPPVPSEIQRSLFQVWTWVHQVYWFVSGLKQNPTFTMQFTVATV